MFAIVKNVCTSVFSYTPVFDLFVVLAVLMTITLIIFTRTDRNWRGHRQGTFSRCVCRGFHRMPWISVVRAANGIISVRFCCCYFIAEMCAIRFCERLLFLRFALARAQTAASKLILTRKKRNNCTSHVCAQTTNAAQHPPKLSCGLGSQT